MLINRRLIRRAAVIVLVALLAVTPGTASGQSGVGVNVGQIQVDQDLSPGGSYDLPSIGVINTGHEASDYSVRIGYRADQQ